MKQIIMIHGSPEPGEIVTHESIVPEWFRWVKENASNVAILPMPLETEVVYEDWVSVFEKGEITKDSILIGHSCGGGFLLRYLSEHPEIRVSKVILVAPWIDVFGSLSTDFMKFEIDPTITGRNEVHIFASSDDMESVVESIKIVKQKLPNVHWHEFTDREHFCGKREFPELLEILK